jgi:small-conductance mechanosensitive channel
MPAGFSPLRTLAVVGVVVLTAFLVGRLNPGRRRQLKHLVLPTLAYLLVLALGRVVVAMDPVVWGPRLLWLALVFETLVFVQAGLVVVLDVVLWRLGIAVLEIVSDLAIGSGYALVAVQTLARAGVSLAGIVTTSAVVSGVVGLALAPTLTNVLGGIALQLERSLRVGDWVRIDGEDVQVKAVRWRHTVFETFNSDTWIVPNTTLLGSTLKLHGRTMGRTVPRRYHIHFHVSLEHPVERVVAVVNEALLRSPIPCVATEPFPHALCADMGRSFEVGVASYFVRYWLTDITQDEVTHSHVRARIDAALRRAGISLAKPEERLRLRRHVESAHLAADAAEQGKRVQLLRSLSLFHGFSDEELYELAGELVRTPYAAGERILVQGHDAENLCILASGEAQVLVASGGREPEKVGTVRAPDFFGERALIFGETRAATVLAVRPCEVYRLGKEPFKNIVLQRPGVLASLSSVIAERDLELKAARESQSAEPSPSNLEARRARLLRQLERFFGLDAGSVG